MQSAATTTTTTPMIIPGPSFARSLLYATAVLAFFTIAFGALTLRSAGVSVGHEPPSPTAARLSLHR